MEKYSKQREEIIEVLKNSYDHPTAEEVYERVKEKKSTSSRGTVYRNLKTLVEKNMVKKIPMSDGPDRYDCARDYHSHFICKKCKKIIDFEYDFKIEALKKQLKTDIYTIDSNSITLYGICKQCFKLIKNKRED
ncbi:MAG: Fur family transcriptional regulator [Candidatus Scatovivens sp.]